MQLATASCVWTQLARHLLTGRRVLGHFFSGRSRVRAFPSGRSVSWHFPSGRSHVSTFPTGCSRVRAFSFWTQPCQGISYWTQPCQGIFLLDAAVSGQMVSGRRVSWHRSHTGCQGMEHRSKYSRRIRKHAAGSRHSDSVQFYSLYLMYIYICYYHTSRRNKGKLANTTRCVEYNVMSTTR